MVNNKHRGSALLTALFIMTLVAIAATAMTTRLQLDIYRTRVTIEADKLYLASQIVPFWAMDFLSDPKRTDALLDATPFPDNYPPIYPEISLTGELIDLQARFNLNNLSDYKYAGSFIRLLNQVLTVQDAGQIQSIIRASTHWVSHYQPSRGQDNFFNYYLQQTPPYQPAHALLKSPSEFRLIQDVDAKVYQQLEPFITALPEQTPINIRTASIPVILTLSPELNEAKAKEMQDKLNQLNQLDKLTLTKILQTYNIPSEKVTTESQYYLSKAEVTSENLSLINYTLLKRTVDPKGNISVTIELESLNTL